MIGFPVRLGTSMAAEPEQKFTKEQLESDEVSKKDILSFVQENASRAFLKDNKLNGKLNNVAKSFKKDQAVGMYNKLFDSKAFKTEADVEEAEKAISQITEQTAAVSVKEKVDKTVPVIEKPKYTKKILKRGNKNGPKPVKSDQVSCLYTGKLEDGTVFDTNEGKTSKRRNGVFVPLRFKVGSAQVIRGWDEALLTMQLQERAEITIQSEWAYGRKGLPDAKIPGNATLIFDVELVDIQH